MVLPNACIILQAQDINPAQYINDNIFGKHHKVVYIDSLLKYGSYENHDVLLEKIFAKFNLNCPKDFHGRSLSVGDIVLICEDDNVSAYRVNGFGFGKIF